ncbi:FAD-dependent oxidoreductase, partial [Acidianus sp. RZ1]|uniref:FAD-dependent oxidoreductase n=1 Tax=Acidianus sp. RZ1 TaxID=1540082 RepID=UPI00149298B4|nr:FAD-dependent oxidoreductase [Acidianus sp. RZ1]
MDVLVLGSSYAGLATVHKLRKFLKDINITIISKSRIVRENTIFPLLLTNDIYIKDTEFDAKNVVESKGVNFIEGEVLEIYPNSREVKTNKGIYDYDYLFLALGGGYEENFRKIPGNEYAVMHHTLEGFLRLKDLLYKSEGNIFVGNAKSSPIEGPSYQVALISEYILRRRGVKAKVYLSTQSPKGIFGNIPNEEVISKANSY